MLKPTHCSLAIALVLTLSACGYSLRGSAELPAAFDTIQLSLQQPNSEFARFLRRSLEVAGIRLLEEDNASQQYPLLEVSNEQVANRPVTVNPRARAAQYEIRAAVDVSLSLMGKTLIPSQTLSAERSYFEDIENIAGSQEEVQILTTEMRRELVNQLLRRLEAAAQSL